MTSNWTLQNTPSGFNNMRTLAYGNVNGTTPTFICLPEGGNTAYYSTNNGITWNPSGLPTNYSNRGYSGSCFGNNKFVGVAYDNGVVQKVIYSSNGIAWYGTTASSDSNWSAVCYGDKYVAVANGGTTRVMTSTDGITWISRTSPIDIPWTAVCYGNNTYVAVGYATGTAIPVMYSVNGINWNKPTDSVPLNAYWLDVAYGNGVFVAIANGYGGTTNQVMTSITGISGWTLRTPAIRASWSSITFSNGIFVVTSDGFNSRTIPQVMTSTNGINWSLVKTPETTLGPRSPGFLWRDVAIGDGKCVAIAFDTVNSQRVMTANVGVTSSTLSNFPDLIKTINTTSVITPPTASPSDVNSTFYYVSSNTNVVGITGTSLIFGPTAGSTASLIAIRDGTNTYASSSISSTVILKLNSSAYSSAYNIHFIPSLSFI